MMVARGWWKGRIGSYCLMSTEFQFGKILKKVLRQMVVIIAQQ